MTEHAASGGPFHRLAHRLGLNLCEGIMRRVPGPVFWEYGVRCLTCGQEKWFA